RAGDAEQHLRLVAAVQAVHQLVDRARLVAAKLEIGDELKAVVLRGHETDDRTTARPTSLGLRKEGLGIGLGTGAEARGLGVGLRKGRTVLFHSPYLGPIPRP